MNERALALCSVAGSRVPLRHASYSLSPTLSLCPSVPLSLCPSDATTSFCLATEALFTIEASPNSWTVKAERRQTDRVTPTVRAYRGARPARASRQRNVPLAAAAGVAHLHNATQQHRRRSDGQHLLRCPWSQAGSGFNPQAGPEPH
jgi:hypothetical protein